MAKPGERIKALRQSLGWTQDRLAQEAGVSKSFLSEIENDKANISGDYLLKIANSLNTSLDYLMKGETVQSERKPESIEIPSELSELAEELALSYKAAVTLLTTHRSLVAKRSSNERTEMTKEGWQDLYSRLKNYLE